MEQISFPNIITYAIPGFFVLIAIELLYQVFAKKKLYRLNDSITDLATGVMSRLVGLFSVLFTGLLYVWLYENARLFNWPTDSAWGMTITFVACFIGYDFVYYWVHRLSHEINFLWAGHVVHHQSEEYNLTVALRQASFHGWFTWPLYLPLAIIGFHPAILLANGQLNLIYQFWIHTRAVGKMGWFEWLFNTPSHHRVHHGKNPKYLDKNHGGTFIIFDRMFGTFQVEEEEPVYGTVKPFKSFNPLWSNLHYWKEMWDMAVAAPKWSDKIKVWFARPGWVPEGFEKKDIPEVSVETYEKFDVKVPAAMSVYSLVWFTGITAFTFAMLVKIADFNYWQMATVGVIGTISLVTVGAVLEGKKWAFVGESLRLVLLAAGAILLSQQPEFYGIEPLGVFTPSLAVALAFTVVCLVSIGIIFLNRPAFSLSQKDYDGPDMVLTAVKEQSPAPVSPRRAAA